jgi:DNA polymerase elongation subunit (family B)
MIADIEQQDGVLRISYYEENGDLAIDKFIIPQDQMFEWEYCQPGEKPFTGILSWDGKPVRKRRVRYLSKWRIEEYLTSLPSYETERIYSDHGPKKFFVDIEVEVGDEWPKAETAKYPVTAITFCHKQKIISMGFNHLSAEQIADIKKRIEEHLKEEVEFNYICFKSEYDMLISFFHKAMQKMPLITGWNFVGYDWTYLFNRCKRLNIDIEPSSPSNRLTGPNSFPMHRLVVDYLEVYKKWDRVIDVKENNTLDFVAKAALGVQKVKYNGTLKELYENDYDSYIFYNAVDTKLVEMIDRKLNTMQTFLTLGNITRVEALKAYSPIYMAEAAMCREFLMRGRVFPRTEKSNKRREKYEGAFVVEPKTGLYEWVTSFDFASLYPSIMRQWNISPESYLRNLQAGETGDPNVEIVCSSGAVFQKGPDSAFRAILTDYYGRRKVAKRSYTEIEAEIENLKKYIK